jgi:hypothetical protein
MKGRFNMTTAVEIIRTALTAPAPVIRLARLSPVPASRMMRFLEEREVVEEVERALNRLAYGES